MFYSVRGGSNQALLIQKIKTAGGDVIQTADGLCVKWPEAENNLRSLVEDATVEKMSRDGELSPDVKAFINK